MHALPLSLADKSHTWSLTDPEERLRHSVDTVDSQAATDKAGVSKGKENTVDGDDQVPLKLEEIVADSWLEVDWEAAEKQRLEDVENGVPGTWTGDGFVPF